MMATLLANQIVTIYQLGDEHDEAQEPAAAWHCVHECPSDALRGERVMSNKWGSRCGFMRNAL